MDKIKGWQKTLDSENIVDKITIIIDGVHFNIWWLQRCFLTIYFNNLTLTWTLLNHIHFPGVLFYALKQNLKIWLKYFGKSDKKIIYNI